MTVEPNVDQSMVADSPAFPSTPALPMEFSTSFQTSLPFTPAIPVDDEPDSTLKKSGVVPIPSERDTKLTLITLADAIWA